MSIKNKIKQIFCQHKNVQSDIIENPSPLDLLFVKAQCAYCRFESYKILARATIDYKIELADNILFERNVKKFTKFYEKEINKDLIEDKDTIVIDPVTIV